jgi:Protein of unknown function (DUF1579)
MTRALALLAVVFCALTLVAQAPAPLKPGPEQKNLDYFNGNWTLDGDLKPGPMGPGGKMTETEQNKWMDGGFFLLSHIDFKSSMGNGTGISVMGFDPNTKMYTYDEYNSAGEAEHAAGTFDGTTWTWLSDENMGGQKMKGRFTIKEISPTSYTFKFEIAPAGGDFATIMDGKATKSKS